jgi:ribosomal protein L11
MNAYTVEQAMKTIAGTAKNMWIKIEGWNEGESN